MQRGVDTTGTVHTKPSTGLFKQFMRDGAFGALCSAVDTLIFLLLTSGFSVTPLVANVVSTLVGVTMSFFINCRYTFQVSDKMLRRYIAFFSIGALGLMVSECIIGFGHAQFPQVIPVYLKLFAVALVGAFQFFLNRNISFREAVGAENDEDELI